MPERKGPSAWTVTSPFSAAAGRLHRGDSRRAARRLVACIEKEAALGGTCLRVGCIPTKAWVQTAHALHAARETIPKLGVVVGAEPQLDFAKANAWKAASSSR